MMVEELDENLKLRILMKLIKLLHGNVWYTSGGLPQIRSGETGPPETISWAKAATIAGLELPSVVRKPITWDDTRPFELKRRA